MVLFASYSSASGGAEGLLLGLLAGSEEDCILACPPGALADAARAAGVRTFALPAHPLRLRGGTADRARALGGLIAHGAELHRLAHDLDPDVVVAWSMRTALAAAPLAGGTPLAFQHNDFLPGRLIGRLVRGAAARCALVTAPSRAVLADLDPRGRLGARAQVIAPGVDLGRFAGAAATAPQPPAELLVLGALTAWKRPELALDVLARVRAAIPDARLRFAGAPLPGGRDALEVELPARAARLGLSGAVELAGAVDDVPGALARASCLLHCAEHEPFGIAVAEALAAGRPAIVPDASGPAEIVDTSCGERYPPGDAAAAATAVLGLLRDPEAARRLGAAGRRRAAERFDRDRQRARYWSALAPLRRRGERPSGPELAVLTVTHNSAADLDALLRSLERHLPGVELVVADCASGDSSRALAAARPGTTVLELDNVGFGRACNTGLAAVRAPVTALLNPDVELLDDSLRGLAAQALSPDRPERLLAPLVLNGDGTRQDTVHPAPLSPPDLIRALLPPALLPGAWGVPLAPWRSTRPRRVGWAVGCALVARTATLRALGPFDPRIFLLGEDMELGLRAARQGVATWFCPEARVIHHGGHSIETAHGGEPFELRARARHDALALARGRVAAAADDGVQALTFASRAALKQLLGRSGERERRQLAALRDRSRR